MASEHKRAVKKRGIPKVSFKTLWVSVGCEPTTLKLNSILKAPLVPHLQNLISEEGRTCCALD